MTTMFPEAAAGASVGDFERYQAYRAVSTLAVASFGLGLLSVLTFVQWVFAVLPLLAILLGLAALRQLRGRGHELTGLPLALAGIILSAVLLPAGWGWLYYVYATEVPPDHQRISYDVFKPTPEEMLKGDFPPATARELDGQRVFLKGYMFPAGNREVKEFTLCRDSGECCFGGQPNLWDMVRVVMKDPPRAEYMTWQRKVAGVLRVMPPERRQHVNEGNVDHQLFFFLEADHLK